MTQPNLLKDQVELLWQRLVNASNETERTRLREEYTKAYQSYKKLMLIRSDAPLPTSSTSPHRQPMEPGCPSPFEHGDYREYLLAWMRFVKEKRPGLLADFSRATGLSLEQVIKVLKRAKRLEPVAHRKVMAFIALPATEEAFLDALYLLSETDSKQVWRSAMKHITSFAAYRRSNPDEYEAWRYLSHWYYVAIRELATLPGFLADAEWVQSRLRKKVPLVEIRKALEFLEKTGFFSRLPDGSVKAHVKFVQCSGGVYRMSLRAFHRQMLEQSIEAIESVPTMERLLLGHTLAVSPATREVAFRILNEAIEKIQALPAGELAGDLVYHIEFSAIPLTQTGV